MPESAVRHSVDGEYAAIPSLDKINLYFEVGYSIDIYTTEIIKDLANGAFSL